MWNKKLCLGTNSNFGLPDEEQIELFHRSGFDAVFTDSLNTERITDCARTVKELNMIYQSVHAPYDNICALWKDDKDAADFVLGRLLQCLESCSRNEIPIMVCHTFIGFEEHNPTQAGIERFGKIVNIAEGLGVRIAFENTEGIEYFTALMDAFKDRKHIGFCWDSGHEMCYNHSEDLLAVYGERLFCTHLNDNLGIKDYKGKITYLDDLHLLPFDGIADWDYNTERLARCRFEDVLTFELKNKSQSGRHENDKYGALPIEQYIAECYNRACRVAVKLIKAEEEQFDKILDSAAIE